MARRPRNHQRLFAALIAKLEPELRGAFEAGARDLQNGAVWDDLIAALGRGDIEGAIASLQIEPAAFQAFAQAKTGAFAQGGALAATTINVPDGVHIAFRFDMANPRAEAWISENVAREIVEMAEDMRQVAREVILDGYQAGRHPHSIARDLAGRVVNGQRQGGVVGLDGPRAHRLAKVSRGMETAEGVRDLVIRHRDGTLGLRYKVNKATEARILRAYRAETAVPAPDRNLSIRQFSNMLLKDRADTIAATETGQAVMSARAEEWRQAAEKMGYPEAAISKTWRHGRGTDKHFRPDHRAMNGKTVQGLNTPFVFPDGVEKQHALDGAGGAGHDARCGCSTDFRLDHTAGLT